MTGKASRDEIHAQYNRASISYDDFGEAEIYLRAVAEVDSEVAKRALLVAAVIAYARPFMESDPGRRDGVKSSRATLSKGWGKALTADERRTHDQVMDIRHKAVAHSAFDSNPRHLVPNTGGLIMQWARKFDVGPSIDLDAFLTLVLKMKEFAFSRMREFARAHADS